MVFLVYTDMSSRGFIMGRPGVHVLRNECYLVPRQLDLDCRWSIDGNKTKEETVSCAKWSLRHWNRGTYAGWRQDKTRQPPLRKKTL